MFFEAKRNGLTSPEDVIAHIFVSGPDALSMITGKLAPLDAKKILLANLILNAAFLQRGSQDKAILTNFNQVLAQYSLH